LRIEAVSAAAVANAGLRAIVDGAGLDNWQVAGVKIGA
jgi:hypothetical protein